MERADTTCQPELTVSAIKDLNELIQGGPGCPNLTPQIRSELTRARDALATGNATEATRILTALVKRNLLSLNVSIVGRVERVLAM